MMRKEGGRRLTVWRLDNDVFAKRVSRMPGDFASSAEVIVAMTMLGIECRNGEKAGASVGLSGCAGGFFESAATRRAERWRRLYGVHFP
jgi:hypothetical protein